MNEDGHTSSIRDKILTITVKKGWKPNTRITFPEEGDQGPNNVPGIQQAHVTTKFAICMFSYLLLFSIILTIPTTNWHLVSATYSFKKGGKA